MHANFSSTSGSCYHRQPGLASLLISVDHEWNQISIDRCIGNNVLEIKLGLHALRCNLINESYISMKTSLWTTDVLNAYVSNSVL